MFTPKRHICIHAWRALRCGNLAATEATWHNLCILFLTITIGFHRGTALKQYTAVHLASLLT